MKAFTDLTTYYTNVRNIIRDDHRHTFQVSTATATLDIKMMLDIFSHHNLLFAAFFVHVTAEGLACAEATLSIR
ncbi:hypothetical protein [Spirosoma pollinicola]|nr:hypothetical protein [Spirosoma pollinicola]